MAAITDFDAWLGCHDFEDFNDVYSLYHSVSEVGDWGLFKTVRGRKDGTYIVHSDICDDDLLLASQAAHDYFLNVIEMKYCGPEMDIEGWYAYKHAMAKED
ncbi:MAG: hypothetical protein Q4A15_01665 [Prevotellaceae bacterium]|nr:hypothetical protein [Prevotellaceae bacterium]